MTDIAEELEKLARLHKSGSLTDEEFARAKDAALRARPDRPELPADYGSDASLGSAAHRYVSFQIAMAVVALVIFLFVFATVFLPRLNAFPRP